MKLDTTKVQILRVKRGLTQQELAEKAKISNSWLSTVLQKGSSSFDLISKLADALDVDVQEILKQ